ncbi:hypothetical protein AKJ16_DCAP09173 [Drosera capensis]
MLAPCLKKPPLLIPHQILAFYITRPLLLHLSAINSRSLLVSVQEEEETKKKEKNWRVPGRE